MSPEKQIPPAKKAAARNATARKAAPAGPKPPQTPPETTSTPATRLQVLPAGDGRPAAQVLPARAPRSTTSKCNVPRCRATPKTRGLCDPHWATHRGYASPSEKRAETAR